MVSIPLNSRSVRVTDLGVGTFESCLGENQDFPGTYVENGQTLTYTQVSLASPSHLPALADRPTFQPPYPTLVDPTYTPRMPASSECQTFQSAELFSGLADVTAPGQPEPTGEDGEDTEPSAGTPTSNGPRPTSSDDAGNQDNADADAEDSAVTIAVSGVSIFAVIFSAMFFA